MSDSGPHCALPYGVYPAEWIQLEAEKYGPVDIDLAEHQTLREETVRDEIARRLAGVCGNLSASEFEHLVSVMAERQLLDERRQRW